MKYWHMLQRGHTLKTLHSVKEARYKKLCIARFHLHETLRAGKSIGRKSISGCQELGGRKGRAVTLMGTGFLFGVVTMLPFRE